VPRKQKLKVYRTPIGFHDAYVAASSQRAALAAWGSDSNLFTQGIAEVVTDPKLMEEPLGRPGEIIRKLRGTSDEQVAALGSGPAKKAAKMVERASMPRPSRASLTEAEDRLRAIQDREAVEMAALEEELAALKMRLANVKRTHAAAREHAGKVQADEQERYERALAEWKKAQGA
jgi:hypothetical protein